MPVSAAVVKQIDKLYEINLTMEPLGTNPVKGPAVSALKMPRACATSAWEKPSTLRWAATKRRSRRTWRRTRFFAEICRWLGVLGLRVVRERGS